MAKRIAAALFLGGVVVAVPVFAQPNPLAMLGSLAKGEWTIKARDGSPERKVCVRSGTELIQLRHRDANCPRSVEEGDAVRVTAHYTCPGNGYGRTTIRKESSSLVQIEADGFADGSPFRFSAEARRTGSC